MHVLFLSVASFVFSILYNDPSLLKSASSMECQSTVAEEEKTDNDSLTISLEKLIKPNMIIFDKDGKFCLAHFFNSALRAISGILKYILGTLGDCTASLRRWAESMTENLASELAQFKSPAEVQSDVNAFHAAIGWDATRRDVFPSAPLAAGTWEEQIDAAAAFFGSFGIDKGLAGQWHNDLGNLHGCDPPLLTDLKGMMRSCHRFNLKVAICTSDDRPSTDASIRNWDLEDVVDVSYSVTFRDRFHLQVAVRCSRFGVACVCSIQSVEMRLRVASQVLNLLNSSASGLESSRPAALLSEIPRVTQVWLETPEQVFVLEC